jgi:hypothetical protein
VAWHNALHTGSGKGRLIFKLKNDPDATYVASSSTNGADSSKSATAIFELALSANLLLRV